MNNISMHEDNMKKLEEYRKLRKFIEGRVNECIRLSENWEERIQTYTEKMRTADREDDLQMYKFKREQCISNKNALLAVADFGNELLFAFEG